jgi:hypothetical protein
MAVGIEIELARAVDGGLSSLRNERPSLTRNRPKNTKTRLGFGTKRISGIRDMAGLGLSGQNSAQATARRG